MLNGAKNLLAGDFSFTLTNTQDPQDVRTVTNDEFGAITFRVEYTEVGVYTYTLKETAGNHPGITYDEKTYSVTVTVTDDLMGRLQAEVSYADGVAPTFINEHVTLPVEIDLEGTKKLSGRDLVAEEFTFEVRDEEGNLVATTKNAADGSLKFPTITLEEAGLYLFNITEVKGDAKDMKYDSTKFVVSVQVTETNGDLSYEITYPQGGVVFKNTYETPDPSNPGTGDDTPLMLLIGLMLCSGAALATLLIFRKRRNNCR